MAIGATAIWRIRPSGNNLNGGGYDPGIGGAATDYSQQNAAQATGTNGATTGAGATTFTDATAAAFTSAMVGNCIQIASGTNFQAGFYFVTAFTNANSVVLDRTPSSGGAGSAGVWKLGGGWADFTNLATAPVSGNTAFVLGSGTPNPASYTYDYTVSATTTIASSIVLTTANDPATPGYKAPPDTTGGMPVIKVNVAGPAIQESLNQLTFSGLWFVGTATLAGAGFPTNAAFYMSSNYDFIVFGCVMDQFGFDVGLATGGNLGLFSIVGCEVFSSVVPGSAGVSAGIMGITDQGTIIISGCNVHDCVGWGINTRTGVRASAVVLNSIIAKCQSDGVSLLGFGGAHIQNCTIDGNLGSGVVGSPGVVFNCIISNHTGVAKFGLNALSPFTDYNVYYNNTTDISGGTYGPHDTHGGSNPYVGQTTENYTLA